MTLQQTSNNRPTRPTVRSRLGHWVVACAAAGCVVVVAAQPIFSEGDLDDAMKGVGRQFELVNRAIAAGDYEEAKVRVTRAREQLSPTISFWRNNRRDEAVAMLRAATSGLDDLDVRLSELTVDPEAVTAAAEDVNMACEACHAQYREQDPSTDTFRLKPGAVD